MDFLKNIPPFNKYKTLYKDMPLKEVADYDRYWEQRIEDLSEDKNEEDIYQKYFKKNRKISRCKFILKYIEDNSSLLDVGCGAGAFMEYLNREKPTLRVEGVDPSQKAIDICERKKLSVRKLNLLNEIIKEEYEYISFMCVLEHVAEAEKLVESIMPNFKKLLFIGIPNLGFWGHRARLAIFGRMPVTGVFYHINEHIRFWTIKDFKVWTKTMGLSIVAMHGCGYLSAFRLGEKYPGLFAEQIVYVLKKV